MYDPNNVFALILRNEIPFKKFIEGPYFLSFFDIEPKAPIHVLVIPKGNYINFHDFMSRAEEKEIKGFFEGISEVIEKLNLKETGYKLIMNTNEDSGQKVFHLHMHVLGGKKFECIV